MGVTIIQKSDLTKKKPNAKVALVLAGGAITGGTFKIGGLKALNDFLVNRKVTDFDMYVGVSAGAFINSHIASGVGPEEILKILDGSSEHFAQLSPFDVYRPNLFEFAQKPLSYLYRKMTYLPGIVYDSMVSLPNLWQPLKESFLQFCSEPKYSHLENLLRPLAKVIYSSRMMPSIGEAFPSGFFSGEGLESYIRGNFEANHLTNNFKVLKRVRGKSLYIVSTDLDTGDRVVFGPDEKNDISISQAVQASSSIPVLYKPARFRGVDYIDGAVKRTTNMDLAIRKGAELVVCYNPFRPYSNKLVLEYLREEDRYVTKNRRLSDSGLLMILNQVFRTVFHTRIRYFIDQMVMDRTFKGDIVLIEPKDDDSTFFEMNPFSFWNRARAAKHGFESVKQTIEDRFDELSRIFGSYGIQMTRDVVEQGFCQLTKSTSDDATIMNILEKESRPRATLDSKDSKPHAKTHAKKKLRLVA